MDIVERVKDLARLAQASDNIQIVKETLALQGELADALQRMRKLQEEVDQLKAKLRLREEMVWDEKMGAYFRAGASDTKEGPFCPKCLDGEVKVIRMAKWDGDYRCTVCRHLLGIGGSPGVALGYEPGPSIMDEKY